MLRVDCHNFINKQIPSIMLRTGFYRSFVQSNRPSSSSEDPSLSSGARSPIGTFGSGVGNSRDSSIGQLEIINGWSKVLS